VVARNGRGGLRAWKSVGASGFQVFKFRPRVRLTTFAQDSTKASRARFSAAREGSCGSPRLWTWVMRTRVV